MLPRIALRAGPVASPIENRSKGGVTGSRVAGALGLVPVEEAMRSRRALSPQYAATTAGGELTLSSYVDNLFSISDSPMGAVWIQEDFEEHVQSKWGF